MKTFNRGETTTKQIRMRHDMEVDSGRVPSQAMLDREHLLKVNESWFALFFGSAIVAAAIGAALSIYYWTGVVV